MKSVSRFFIEIEHSDGADEATATRAHGVLSQFVTAVFTELDRDSTEQKNPIDVVIHGSGPMAVNEESPPPDTGEGASGDEGLDESEEGDG